MTISREMSPATAVTFFLLVIMGQLSVVSACEHPFLVFDGRCYAFIHSAMPWHSALAVCNVHNATLAQPKSAEVNSWIKDQIKENKLIDTWLGGTDSFVEGTWDWADGKTPISGYTDWKSPQPDDHGDGEDCLSVIVTNGDYYWNDVPCTRNYDFVCEKNIKNERAKGRLRNPWFG